MVHPPVPDSNEFHTKSGKPNSAFAAVGDPVLTAHLLADPILRSRRIIALKRRACPYSSSYALQEVDVSFDDGSGLPLMLKDFDSSALLPEAAECRPLFLFDPQREVRVYRHLLPQYATGTAHCYAAVSESGTANQPCTFLLMERLNAERLSEIGEIEAWLAAARWIARLHRASFENVQEIMTIAELPTHDATFYGVWFDRALSNVQAWSTKKRSGASAPFSSLERAYDIAAKRLSTLRPALIHGEFYPANILVDRRDPTARICPVDWERAAIAPGILDLAALSTGGWTDLERQRIAREYYCAVDTSRAQPFEEMLFDLECGYLFWAVQWLGWSNRWQPPSDQDWDWLREAGIFANCILHRGGQA